MNRRGFLKGIGAALAVAVLRPSPESDAYVFNPAGCDRVPQYPLGTIYVDPSGRKFRYMKFVRPVYQEGRIVVLDDKPVGLAHQVYRDGTVALQTWGPASVRTA